MVISPIRGQFAHYNDVIMGTMASQITSLTIVYSTVYSSTDQRKHQSSTSLTFVREIHRASNGKCFHLMTASCIISWHSRGFRFLSVIPSHDDVIKWKHFRIIGHLCGEFTCPGEFPAQRHVTRSFDVFFDLRLNEQSSKQSWSWWFETRWRPLLRHCNV